MKLKAADKKSINNRENKANQMTFLCGVNITLLSQVISDSQLKR
jgi:hypothetical protein